MITQNTGLQPENLKVSNELRGGFARMKTKSKFIGMITK
jgi:hypothetical protein